MTDWRRRVRGTGDRFAPPAVAVLVLTALVTACAGKPAVTPTPPVTYEQKIGWILQLEDQRILREPAAATTEPASSSSARHAREGGHPALDSRLRGNDAGVSSTPDLVALLGDADARIRRRAALAIGRVGLAEGVAPLERLLSDPEPEVRQMAAFALGLIDDTSAVPSLIDALKDPSLLVQGSAAQALGLIGDDRAADPIGAVVSATVQSGAIANIPADDMGEDRDTPAGVFRLGVSALARLHAWNALAAAVLDSSGQLRVRWWPAAYALQWIHDRRAEPALLALAGGDGVWAQAFSARGLGALEDRAAVDRLIAIVKNGAPRQAARGALSSPKSSKNPAPAIEAARALGEIGDARAVPVLVPLLAPGTDPGLRLEAVQALGALHTPSVVDRLLDLASDPAPAIRSAAIDAIARLDSQTFMLVLSGLDPDPQWSVRAALAGTLTRLPPDQAVPRLRQMLDDRDSRVIPSVLAALTKLHAPDLEPILLDRLRSDDPFIRKAAAQDLEAMKPADVASALAQAYERGVKDPTYVARAAALDALTAYGAAAATPTLKRALTDPDWAVRVKAADLLRTLDPRADVAHAIRPAPTSHDAAYYQQSSLVAPAVSPQLYIDTAKGTIVVELAVLDAPNTAETLMTLARRGFFDRVPIHRVVPDFVVQDGDPRGDGDGGPGFTIRDELNERMYAPGTVGIAIDWRDTGGSQFFITTSPQPRLDAAYTVVGRVTSGLDVVSRIQAWDLITRVRVWDGERMSGS